MIPQAASVNWRILVLPAKSEHFHQRCHSGRVTKIIGVPALGCMRYCFGFASDKVDVSFFLQFVSHEWKAEATVIGSAPDVPDHHIWCDIQEFKLLLDF